MLRCAGSSAAGAGAAGGAPPPGGSGFDYTFPVELEAGRRLTISWNRGDDPSTVAMQFCIANGLPGDQLGDIVNFIHTAQGQAGGAAAAASPPPPLAQAAPATAEAKQAMLAQVMAMGFPEDSARAALDATGWAGVEPAIAVLFGN